MNQSLAPSTMCVELVKHFEGLHDGNLQRIGLQPKRCPAGYWTIGWGHLVLDPETRAKLSGDTGRDRALELYPNLTLEQAERLLKADLEVRAAIVRRVVQVPLTQGQFDALVSFEFNTGAIGGQKTIVAYLNSRQMPDAANELRRWVYAGGRKLPGLVARRENERLLFITGKWTRP